MHYTDKMIQYQYRIPYKWTSLITYTAQCEIEYWSLENCCWLGTQESEKTENHCCCLHLGLPTSHFLNVVWPKFSFTVKNL